MAPNPHISPSRRLGDLSHTQLRQQLRGAGLLLAVGPAVVRLRSPLADLAELLALLYRDFPVAEPPLLPDATLQLEPTGGLRRLWRPQVRCLVDGRPPFEVLPRRLAYPMFEWALNWTVASRLQRFFMIHAAVVADHDRALILPAWSGSGKSTLCAALIQRGWRLLSDEFCLLSLDDGLIHPMPRPIPLKNESIPAFRAFAPEAVMGPIFFQTRKGDISHLQPPTASLTAIGQTARPAWVVLPRYQAGAHAALEAIDPGRGLMLMASNSFNFNLLGAPAFRALGRLFDTVSCDRLSYSDLDQAVAAVERLRE